jgi:hypothetical protein
MSESNEDNTKLEGWLAVAVIGLVIFAVLYFSANSTVSQQAAMIDTCVSNLDDYSSTLDDANSAIESMNGGLDTISSNASDAALSDYDTQEATLEDISSTASGAQNSDDFSAPTNDCAQLSDTSDSSN